MLGQKFIFDALTRHQVFLEELKEDRYLNHIDPTLRKIARVVRSRLGTLPNDAFETMSRKQFAALVSSIMRDLQSSLKDFEKEEEEFNASFTATDNVVQRAIFSKNAGAKVPKAATRAAAQAAIIPALGVQGKDVTTKFVDDTLNGIREELVRGFADNDKVDAVKDAIVGTKAAKYRDGFLVKAKRWYRSNVSSHMQSISMIGTAEYAQVLREQGQFTNYYIWKSVLDSRTSDICRARSNNIYEYGKGPLPPAHPNCRSNTIPLLVGIKAATAKNFPSNWLSWLEDQPEPVLAKMLGIDYTAKLSDQRALAKFNPLGTVTLGQFEDATSVITYAKGID